MHYNWVNLDERKKIMNWKNKRVMLTGGSGFLGQYVNRALQERGCRDIFIPRSDNFDPRTSHVIPALIKKCFDAMDAGENEIVVWGDGSPTREFLYVTDAAEGIVMATELYDQPEPVNVGSSFEISIRDLAAMIAEETGFAGQIVFDTSKPNGQPRRKLDVDRAKTAFGFEATTDFRAGVKEMIAWYRAQRAAIAAPAY